MNASELDDIWKTLLDEKERLSSALEYLKTENPGAEEEEVPEISSLEEHLAEAGSLTLDREIDYSLEEAALARLEAVEAALERMRGRKLRSLWVVRGRDRARAAAGAALDEPLYRLQKARGARLNGELKKHPEVRVGSSPDGLAPISVAEKKLAAGPWQWITFTAVAVCAIAADQFTKWLVTSRLALGSSVEVAGPLKISHVQNPGIAFGLFSAGDIDRDRSHLGRRALDDLLLRPLGRSPPAATGSAGAGYRGQRLQPVRPRRLRACDRLRRCQPLAVVQSCRLLHRARSRHARLLPDRPRPLLSRAGSEAHKAPGS